MLACAELSPSSHSDKRAGGFTVRPDRVTVAADGVVAGLVGVAIWLLLPSLHCVGTARSGAAARWRRLRRKVIPDGVATT